jgi:hypothetical protein
LRRAGSLDPLHIGKGEIAQMVNALGVPKRASKAGLFVDSEAEKKRCDDRIEAFSGGFRFEAACFAGVKPDANEVRISDSRELFEEAADGDGVLTSVRSSVERAAEGTAARLATGGRVDGRLYRHG